MITHKELTRAELEIMQIIWKKEKVFLSDIINEIPEPRPAYTTVSTVVRTLVRKNFVVYKQYGKIHRYYPVISKEEYTKGVMKVIKKNFFDGSFSNMISFFAKKEKIS